MSDIGGKESSPANGVYGKVSDTLGKTSEALQNKASEAADAVKATVDDVSERANQTYTRGNVAVTRAVDPIPSLLFVGVVGFLIGYVCSELRR